MTNERSFPVATQRDIDEFCFAAQRGDNAIVSAYADKYGNAILDAKNVAGHTALILAVSSGRESTVLLLIEKGASFDIQDPSGMTALAWAKAFHYQPMVTLLEEAAEKREQQKKQKKQKEKQDREHDASAAAEQRLKKLKQMRPAKKPLLKKGFPK